MIYRVPTIYTELESVMSHDGLMTDVKIDLLASGEDEISAKVQLFHSLHDSGYRVSWMGEPVETEPELAGCWPW